MSAPAEQPQRIGRLRAAWLVLTGQKVVPQQIFATWLEYQQMFDSILERWSAQLARQAKAERKRIDRLELEPEQQLDLPMPTQGSKDARQQMKAQLRASMVAGGAPGRVQAGLAARGQPAPPPSMLEDEG